MNEPPQLTSRDRLNEARYTPIELDQYEPLEPGSNSPLQFYRRKYDPEDMIVNILGHVDRVSRGSDPEMDKFITSWSEVSKVAMLDEKTTRFMADLLQRHRKRQPTIVEGPPAVTKTFGIWALSAALNAPYARVNFSPGSKDRVIKGGPAVGVRHARMAEDDFLKASFHELNPVSKQYAHTLREKKDRGEAISDAELEVLGRYSNYAYFDDNTFDWGDSESAIFFENGGFLAYDEPNTVEDSAVLEAALPIMEKDATQWRIPGRPGEPLNRHPDFFPIWAQNSTKVRGRSQLSQATLSRAEMITLPPIEQQDLENLMRFFITGSNPSFTIYGITYQGKQDIQTPYRGILEQIPDLDSVIGAIAKTHMTLMKMVEEHTIAIKEREGGNYVFDMRRIPALLDSIAGSINGGLTKANAQGQLEQETDWEIIIKKALHNVYSDGVQEGDDKRHVRAIIDSMPIWNYLSGQHVQLPDWALGGQGVSIEPNAASGGFDVT